MKKILRITGIVSGLIWGVLLMTYAAWLFLDSDIEIPRWFAIWTFLITGFMAVITETGKLLKTK